MPINFVSRLLGHINLTTTSRYLNIHRRGLHMAMQKFEESRRVAEALQDPAEQQPESEPASEAEHARNPAFAETYRLVRKRGLEPPPPCGDKLLSRVNQVPGSDQNRPPPRPR